MQGGDCSPLCFLLSDMILGCVIFYDDELHLIERCFRSLMGKVGSIIAIDGAYKEFPHDKPYSTNGALDIAKKYSDDVIETSGAWKDQATKRNSYLALRNESDYYFILDADEELIGEFPEHLDKDVYKIYLKRITERGELGGEYCRLIRHQHGIRYTKKHNLLIANGKVLSYPSPFLPCLDRNKVKIHHHMEERTKARIMADGHYLRSRQEEKTYIDFGKLDREYTNEVHKEILEGVL